MFRRGISVSAMNVLVLGCVLLACSIAATAQHHAGGGSSSVAGSGSLSSYSRPTGVKEEDSLKDFHQTLSLQASSQQVADYQALIKSIEAAQAGLQSLLQELRKANGPAEAAGRDSLDHALDNARTGSKKFQDGLSPTQKAGLKEISKRLAKADSDLDLEQKKLDQILDAKVLAPEVVPHADSLDKALTDFYNQQLALGREMSITLASGQDLAFVLPQVKKPVRLQNLTIPVTVSGVLSQIAVQGSQRTFKLELMADLSDLQQNILELLRSELNSSETCGQRVEIRQARLTPAIPVGLLVVRLHFERWMCTRGTGQTTSNELAEGDGIVEIKLTASVEKENKLSVKAGFGRIDAAGMLGAELRSGSLGEDLLDNAAEAVLNAARAGTDFQTSLPLAVQKSAALQNAKFREVGVGGLSVVLEGQIEISNEQADQLANQLNQTLSAQRAPTQ